MTINVSDLLSGASSSRSTTLIVNQDNVVDLGSIDTCRITNSGSLTLNTFKTMVNISGVRGIVSFCAVKSNDTTIRTISLRVTADGNIVYNKSGSTSQLGRGLCAAGAGGTPTPGGSSAGASNVGAAEIKFQSTLLIEISSNITEVDKIALMINYTTEA